MLLPKLIDCKIVNCDSQMELAEVYIPQDARDHIKALLPYAIHRRIITSRCGISGWELQLRIPKRLINPDVDIAFLQRNNITMQIEGDEYEVDYSRQVIRESEYYNINLIYNG